MHEMLKTAIFLAAGLAVGVIVWVTAPRSPDIDIDREKLNKPLYDRFDPEDISSIEIVEFDEENADRREFEVAQVDVDGKPVWSIPSHEEYPADAEQQLAEAAAALMDLTVLEIPSKEPADHEIYGVINPDPDLLKSGASGVGDRVTLKGKEGKTLLSLIVGKKVSGEEEPGPSRGEATLRYVRKAGEDPVYVVALKTDKLSTKFNDWIEPDLLKIKTFDIKQLRFHDYIVAPERGALMVKGDVTVEYNEANDPKWKLLKNMEAARFGGLKDAKMPPDMVLNTENLDKAKDALDDLQIVDVYRKPEGLSADLRADENLMKNRESGLALRKLGFYVAPFENRVEVFSDQGEIRCLMKDGVEYILRFGTIAIGSKARSSDEKDGEAGSLGLNRYLFVTAEFNPKAIPEPRLEIPKEAEPKPEGPEAELSKEEEEKEKAESERIKTANQRKRDAYESKIKEGKEHAKKLNARFADWYYIISDDVFRKMHLSYTDIFKKKTAEKPHDHGGPPAGMPPMMPGMPPKMPPMGPPSR